MGFKPATIEFESNQQGTSVHARRFPSRRTVLSTATDHHNLGWSRTIPSNYPQLQLMKPLQQHQICCAQMHSMQIQLQLLLAVLHYLIKNSGAQQLQHQSGLVCFQIIHQFID